MKTTRISHLLLAGILVGLLSACTANKAPSKVETALANMAKDVAIPIQAEDVKNPLPETPQVIEEGRAIYNQSCALCHGMDGHAATEMGRAMYPPAMDLTSPHVQHWNGSELFWIIQNGVRLTGMPAWKNILPETDTWKIVYFIHSLPNLKLAGETPGQGQSAAPTTPEQRIAYGRTLYRQEGCFMCHQLNGEGGKVGPDLTSEGRRGRSDDWLIGHFKDPQAYSQGSIMPSFKNLTDEQLHALTTFLQAQVGGLGGNSPSQ